MKNYILLILGFCFILQSCTQEEEETNNDFDAQEFTAIATVDEVSDEIDNFAELGINSDDNARSTLFPNCATVTSEPLTATTRKSTIYFPSGCTTFNGVSVQGTIYLEYDINIDFNEERNIDVTFDNFTYNSVLVNGTKNIKRTVVGSALNDIDYIKADVENDLTLTYLNQDYLRTGTIYRKFISGFYTLSDYTDDEFTVYGNRNTIFPDNLARTITVNQSDELLIKLNCQHIVSGIADITLRNNVSFSVDYGNGNCDNDATVILEDGTEIQVEL